VRVSAPEHDPVPSPDTRLLLERSAGGDAEARDDLLARLYDELKRIAGGQMQRQRENHTLQPTALVHEAWIKLMGGAVQEWEGREHFLAVSARAMRQVLVDHVRAKGAQKRGGEAVSRELDETIAFLEGDELDLLDLEEALTELEGDDPELAQIVELRFFGGLSHPRIAELLDCSLSTVDRAWRVARARLRRRLASDSGME
jgi:RNA polymerase sigma factor (TIGR02999 family)